MSLSFGYLTPRQRRIWLLRLKGYTQAEVSRELGVTRQTVNKAFSTIDAKMRKALMEAAEMNRVEIRRLDSTKGYLVGYSPIFETDVIITFSSRNGIKVWYRGKEHCEECNQVEACRRTLLDEAEERSIQVPENIVKSEPSGLADYLLDKIVGV